MVSAPRFGDLMSEGNILELEVKLATLLAGVRQKLPSNASFTIGGVVYTRDELARAIESDLELFRGARESWAASRQKAHERDRRTPALRIFLQEVRSMLNSQFGQESAELVDFGFRPRRRPARRSEPKPGVNPAKSAPRPDPISVRPAHLMGSGRTACPRAHVD